VVTWLTGDGAPLPEDAVEEIAARAAPELEADGHFGGQAHYWWLLAAE
jgi:hypothetical protein